MGQWKDQGGESKISTRFLNSIFCLAFLIGPTMSSPKEFSRNLSNLDKELVQYVDDIFDSYDNTHVLAPELCIEKKEANYTIEVNSTRSCESPKKIESVEDYFHERWDSFANSHVKALKLSDAGRFFTCKLNSTSVNK